MKKIYVQVTAYFSLKMPFTADYLDMYLIVDSGPFYTKVIISHVPRMIQFNCLIVCTPLKTMNKNQFICYTFSRKISAWYSTNWTITSLEKDPEVTINVNFIKKHSFFFHSFPIYRVLWNFLLYS